MALPPTPSSFTFITGSVGTNGDDNVEISRDIAIFSGLNGNDYIILQNGDSVYQYINGNAGNDVIIDGNGLSNDTLLGGKGDDTLLGQNGDNVMNGNIGDDSVSGGINDDLLNGGKGNDSVDGGSGNDTVYGDLGDDSLSGGGGSDIFVFTGAKNPDGAVLTETDAILDFSASDGDKIALTNGVAFANITLLTNTSTPYTSQFSYDSNGIHHIVTVSNAAHSVHLTSNDFIML